MESVRILAAFSGARARVAASFALGCAAVSCAALIGIDGRLADDAPSPDASLDAPSAVDGAMTTDASPAVSSTYGVGDGHTGPRVIMNGNTVVNSYAALGARASGTNTLRLQALRGEPFATGDLILVWQTATPSPPPVSGRTIDVVAANVGHWEVARVTAVAPPDGALTADLTLDHPVGVAYAYAVPGAQVVRVPEFTDLTLPVNTGINALPWDGRSGGVIAVYVRGTLRNDGTFSVEGNGFRGGVALVTNNGALMNCGAANGDPDDGFAAKGEGFVVGSYPDAGGLGNVTNGGGGGNCYNAGGGGGGNGGQGGKGGLSGDGDQSRDVGGRGGAALAYPSLLDRLSFGGGGGAGEEDNGLPRNGGAGGGVIVVRAQEIVLPGGRYNARGGAPGRADQSGGAGGGGGGSILVQSVGAAGCQQITVRGGAGASLETVNGNNGPGGGGGGGRVLLQGGATACSIESKAGTAGRDNTNTLATRGATPDAGAEQDPTFSAPAQLVSMPYCGTCL